MFRVKRSGENRVDLELYGKLDGEPWASCSTIW